MKKMIYFIRQFTIRVNDTYIAAYAARAAFFILLSVVPLISLILAIATYLPFSQQDVISVLMQVVPKEFFSYVQSIVNELYAQEGKTVISISAVTILWSASKGIAALIDGMNSMYKIEQKPGFFKARMMAVIYTVFLIVIFAMVMTVYVLASHNYKKYIQIMVISDTIWKKLLLFIRYILGWLLFYLFILFLYVVLPGRFGIATKKNETISLREKIKGQMTGAAFASVAWIAISKIVGIYITNFPNFSVMYGSLAGVAIVMLWLYFCMYSIFIGAVINDLMAKGYLTEVKKMLQ